MDDWRPGGWFYIDSKWPRKEQVQPRLSKEEFDLNVIIETIIPYFQRELKSSMLVLNREIDQNGQVYL